MEEDIIVKKLGVLLEKCMARKMELYILGQVINLSQFSITPEMVDQLIEEVDTMNEQQLLTRMSEMVDQALHK